MGYRLLLTGFRLCVIIKYKTDAADGSAGEQAHRRPAADPQRR